MSEPTPACEDIKMACPEVGLYICCSFASAYAKAKTPPDWLDTFLRRSQTEDAAVTFRHGEDYCEVTMRFPLMEAKDG